MQNLPLQIGQVDCVVVAQRQIAHPACGEEQRRRTAQPARPDNQRTCMQQFLLSFDTNVRQKNMAAIAQ